SLVPHPVQRGGAGSRGRGHVSEDDHRAGRPAGVHPLSWRWKSRRDVAHETRDRRWLGYGQGAGGSDGARSHERNAEAVLRRADSAAKALTPPYLIAFK